MSPLGRGLASLIPPRKSEDVDEALEQIDSLEVVEEQEAITPEGGPPEKPKVTYLDPGTFKGPVVDAKKKRTMLTVEQLPDDEPAAAPKPKKRLPVKEAKAEKPFGFQAQSRPSVAAWTPFQPVTATSEPEPAEKPESSPAPAASNAAWDIHEEKVVQIPIGDIQINPLQPRRSFDPVELEELVSSIDEHGILQPLVVRRVAPDHFELIAGERRLRAAKQLGWEKVPCVVKVEVAGSGKGLVYALIENLQREDLNPMEEALAYERLNKEFGMTHEEIGKAMGSSRVRVTNSMRVLQLPVEIQRGLQEGKITAGHAKAILMIPDPEKQIRFYSHLVEEGLTVRKAEVRARRIQRAMKVDDPMRHKNRRGRHPISVKYRPYLEERFGFNADVKYLEQKNRYEVVFRAYSDGEVEELINRLLGQAALPQHQDEDVMDAGEDTEDDEE